MPEICVSTYQGYASLCAKYNNWLAIAQHSTWHIRRLPHSPSRLLSTKKTLLRISNLKMKCYTQPYFINKNTNQTHQSIWSGTCLV
jgi:hypothetical protein